MISDSKLIYIIMIPIAIKIYLLKYSECFYHLILLLILLCFPHLYKKSRTKQKHLDHVLLIDTQLRHSRMIKHITLINHLFNECVTATGRIIWEPGLSGSKWLHCCGLCLRCISAFILFCLLIKFLSWACFVLTWMLVCVIFKKMSTCLSIHNIKALIHTNT